LIEKVVKIWSLASSILMLARSEKIEKNVDVGETST
jgi:hypothetical protein